MFEPTEFAPAERASSEALARQTALFQGSLVAIALNAIPAGVIITNTHRQIVFGNPVFASLTGSSQTELLGLRPGEALSCSNATLSSGGCGTTQFCRHCGAAQAILQSLSGEPAVNECHLIRKDIAQDASLDMQIFTSPFTHAGETFTLLTALDVSHERRIKAIESYYFTDVLADVGNIRNLAEMLETEVQPELWEYCQHLRFVSKRLLEGMAAYRDLGEVEQGNFQPSPEVITSRETIESVAQLFRAHAAAEGKQVRLDPECPPGVRLTTDPVLLSRVLFNLLRNALEATEDNEIVTIGCRGVPTSHGGGIEFWVHNPGHLPETHGEKAFERAFTTKGEGRGIGLYVARLYARRYLGGEVDYVSDEVTGTEFRIRLPR